MIRGERPPLQLPSLPARRNWNRAYLTAGEAKNIVDPALAMKMVARLPPAQPGPTPG